VGVGSKEMGFGRGELGERREFEELDYDIAV
jgi:hypothetical protein